MAATLGVPRNFELAEALTQPVAESGRAQTAVAGWEPEEFAQEQVRGLVRQVFFSKEPRAAKQVVFSAAEPGMEVAWLCLQVGEAVAAAARGSVCLVEANVRAPRLEQLFGRPGGAASKGEAGSIRESSRQISDDLWLVPAATFLGESANVFSGIYLRSRLSDLRLEFDYAVLHAAPAVAYSEAALLGQIADGMILVLQAHNTRRVAALRTKEILEASNVRLLGTVLKGRTFPVPERIYRKL